MCRLWRQPGHHRESKIHKSRSEGGGADEATRSFGKRRVGDEARGSPPVVRHEFENWTLPERKGRRKESSSRYHQDLMNARNLRIFSSDGDFGNHRFYLLFRWRATVEVVHRTVKCGELKPNSSLTTTHKSTRNGAG